MLVDIFGFSVYLLLDGCIIQCWGLEVMASTFWEALHWCFGCRRSQRQHAFWAIQKRAWGNCLRRVQSTSQKSLLQRPITPEISKVKAKTSCFCPANRLNRNEMGFCYEHRHRYWRGLGTGSGDECYRFTFIFSCCWFTKVFI